MSNVLTKIVADKREFLAKLKQQLPLDSFIAQLKPSTKDFYGAMSRTPENPEAKFLLECKKASPSKGLIRADFDPVVIATIYQQYAGAISVLTDEKYFQGNYQYLQQVANTMSCPVLNKDFFVDPYQVYLARYYGADAILLMLSVLTDNEYQTLSAIAEQLNLGILTEVSTPEECHRATQLGAKMVGINNRNLRDLSTDIQRTVELRPLLPESCIVLSESGIYTHNQVRQLASQVDGFLVGSSIMAQTDIDSACRRLIYGEHKVCGLTRIEDAKAVAHAGGYYGGLIFAPKSPRCISQQQAQSIIHAVPSLHYVGVFVDESVSFVSKIAHELGLSAVQLHGEEDATYHEQLKPLLPPTCELWQAISVTDHIAEFSPFANKIVLDNQQGGSGKTFNWQLLNSTGVALNRAILAGGINTENINNAIRCYTQYQMLGLDINSGVEVSPGIKSSTLIEQVFSKIRHY